MNKREILVIITPGFPADEDDSTCIPPQQLFVRALKEQRPQLNIIILSLQYPFTPANYTWHGMPIIAFGGPNRGRFYRLALWLKVWKTLKQLNRECQLTGIVSFWLGECAFIGNRFARRYKLQHYCWLLGQDARPGNNYVKLAGLKGDQLIALSDSLSKEFNTNYGIKPQHIIPPGIDPTMFGAPIPEKHIDIMGAGSLIPLKQYHLFVDIVKKLTLSFPSLKTAICGKGPEMENLKRQIKNNGLEKNIKIKGELPQRDVLALMQRSKIFLHTSNYEGFGVVLTEALYAGARVVSFVKPMDDMPAEFHQAKNEEDIVNTITGLLSNADLSHYPVLIYPIDMVAKEVAGLFER